jgi:hypothetical protein
MLKALLAPYLGWIYGAAAVAIVTGGTWIYYTIDSRAYDRGYQAAVVVKEKEALAQKAANDKAIAASEKGLREDVAAIILEKEKLEDDLARLDAESAEDPDADTGGIKRNGVQRINAVR